MAEEWNEVEMVCTYADCMEMVKNGSDDGHALEQAYHLEDSAKQHGLTFVYDDETGGYHLEPIEADEETYDTPDTKAGDIGNINNREE